MQGEAGEDSRAIERAFGGPRKDFGFHPKNNENVLNFNQKSETDQGGKCFGKIPITMGWRREGE